MASGRCVGHKRILTINQFLAKEVRLRITQSVSEPVVRRFAVFEA